jgi:transposase
MTKPSQEVDSFRRIEVITGVGRRRRWTEERKAAIVAETLEEGAVVSAVARKHGVAPSQVFGWRKAALERSSNLPVEMAAFAAVTLDGTRLTGPALCEPASLMIEVEIKGAKIRIPPDAAPKTITAIIQGLCGLPKRRR